MLGQSLIDAVRKVFPGFADATELCKRVDHGWQGFTPITGYILLVFLELERQLLDGWCELSVYAGFVASGIDAVPTCVTQMNRVEPMQGVLAVTFQPLIA